MGLVWTGIAIAAVVIVVIAVQTARPGMRRRAAVRQALAEAETAARANDRDLDAQVRLAQVQLDLAEMPREARAILERVIGAQPLHWADDAPPTRFLLAHAHVKSGDLPGAIEHYQTFVAAVASFDTRGDKERKWLLETHKVDAEQRIRLLKKGDTHVHQPEKWGDQE